MEAEGLVEEHDVVVDGFGDADDGDLKAAFVDFIGDGQAAAEGAVAADDEEDVDGHAFEAIDDFDGVLVAAGGAEDGAAALVDFGDHFGVEVEDVVAVAGDEAA